jgi:thiol-disulfide isomerase/thioredoxin
MVLLKKNSSVKEITESDFKGKSLKIKKPSGLVFFGAEWCHFCKLAFPEFEKASKMLGGSASFYFFDCAKNSKFPSEKFGIHGYPTVMYVDKNGEISGTYDGPRTSQGYLDAILRKK